MRISRSSEFVLPANLDAERCILGAILIDNAAFGKVSVLRAHDFSLDSNRHIFACMVELQESGHPVDLVTLTEELGRKQQLKAVGGVEYISSLTDGVPRLQNVEHHLRIVREKALLRRLIFTAEAAVARAMDGERAPELVTFWNNSAQEFSEYASGDTGSIRTFDDLPDIFDADLEEPSYLVSGLIPRGAFILMAGEPGIGKSYLALHLAISCVLATRFLGRECTPVPVLYLDRENPGSIVRERVQRMAGGPIPALKIWGAWLKDPVPNLDDPRLLYIAKEHMPLIVVDSLIRFHDGEENSASDMSRVQAKLKALTVAGATVLTIHHRGKGEGAAEYRGSSDIGGGPDVLYSLTRDTEGLLTLKHVKNRFGAELKLTIRPDYEAGTFELTEAPTTAERRDKLSAIRETIAGAPGLSQNQIVRQSGLNRTEACRLLREFDGHHWRSEPGPHNSLRYFPMSCTTVLVQPGTAGIGED